MIVVRMCWMQISCHARNTILNELPTPLRSSSTPWSRAMLSAFSRNRVSTYRYSASAWSLFSDALMKQRPMTAMAPLAATA
jgi:hypothetical protein